MTPIPRFTYKDIVDKVVLYIFTWLKSTLTRNRYHNHLVIYMFPDGA